MTEELFLQEYNISKYPRPSVAADIALFSLLRDKPNADIKNVNVYALQLLLIKRAQHPFLGKWALPGGFCRPNESVDETVRRELFEETHIENAYLKLSGIYGKKDRDPRGWIISNAWIGLIDRYACDLRADTDAWEAAWFTLQSFTSSLIQESGDVTEYLHTMTFLHETTGEIHTSCVKEVISSTKNMLQSTFTSEQSELAFDHSEIICETFLKLRDELKEDIRPLFCLLPDSFTLGELQAAYELLTGKPSQNFRRRILDYVVETDQYAEVKGYRPAKLFRRKKEKFLLRTYH